MLHINETIVVEGKYDKEQLKKITDAPIICTGGFALYTNKNIIASIRTMAKKTGIIILTDSDSAGFRIRNYIRQCVGNNGVVKHAYIPTIEGKEKRKANPGKAGLLGVEGMTEESLEKILKTVVDVEPIKEEKKLTKTQFYIDGLSGGAESCQRRKLLAKALGIPARISANAMIELINTAFGIDEYERCLKQILNQEDNK